MFGWTMTLTVSDLFTLYQDQETRWTDRHRLQVRKKSMIGRLLSARCATTHQSFATNTQSCPYLLVVVSSVWLAVLPVPDETDLARSRWRGASRAARQRREKRNWKVEGRGGTQEKKHQSLCVSGEAANPHEQSGKVCVCVVIGNYFFYAFVTDWNAKTSRGQGFADAPERKSSQAEKGPFPELLLTC